MQTETPALTMTQKQQSFCLAHCQEIYDMALPLMGDPGMAKDVVKSVLAQALTRLAANENEEVVAARLMGFTEMEARLRLAEQRGKELIVVPESAKPTPEPDELTPAQRKKRARRMMQAHFVIGLNICIGLFLTWVILGLLHRLGLLPSLDLGFTWFNDTFFRLF